MKIQLTIMTLFLSFWATAQVGIGNTDPKATLDITASNAATPSNTDGLLIPRVDEFPITDPTAAQDGMMVFVTGAGTPSKGFYYWDNTGASWVNVNTGGDSDWYEEGTTTAPNSINDDIFTQGNVAIGKNTAFYSLDIESTRDRGINTLVTGNSNITSYGHYVENSKTGFGDKYASYNRLNGTGSGSKYGSYQHVNSNAYGSHYGSYNYVVGTDGGSHYGIYNTVAGNGNASKYGNYSTVGGSGFGAKYGSYNLIPSSAGGTHYGVYSDVQKLSGYAGYFIGRMSLGNTTSNRYLMPAADGAANYIMQTNGFGQVSFVNPAIIGTDNQNLTGATLSGTSLRINIENGNFTTVNLASLQDGTGTDDQNITGSGLAGTNLTIGIENGTSQIIDLSSLQDGIGTDNQNLTGATLTGTSLQIDIENGSSTTVDLVGLQDGDTQNTLDQAYDEGGAGSGRTISATDGAVTIAGEDGFTVTGTLNSGDAIAVTGAGTRMFFNPRKSAFRAGTVNGTQWDNSNIGNYSFASGSNTTASGAISTALGSSTLASGASSLAMGNTTIASGDGSTAMGNSTTASGLNSFTSGYLSTAIATASVAMGLQNNAPSWGEMTVGVFATTYSANSTASWNPNDRLFTVGNGTDLGSRSNALTIYKNGLLNINDEYNMPLTDGTANYIMQTNGSGQLSFVDPATIGDGTGTDNQNLTGATLTGTSLQIDIENGSSTTVDLVGLQDGDTQNTLDQAYDEGGAGSGRTISATDGAVTIAGEDGFTVTGTLNSGDAIAVTGAGIRMFFNPRTASFRTGSVNGTQWDNSNIGNFSFASGSNTTASGAVSTALGSSTLASGASSLAMGISTIASGESSTAMGNSTTASGSNSFTSGYLSTAIATASVAMGLQNNAPSWSEMTVGAFATTYSANSTAGWSPNDRLFTVGNGTGLGSRSNALTIYKNGLLNINDEYNMPLTDGTANYIMQTNGAGQVSFVNPATIGDGTGTDNQNLTGATLTGTSLQIDIQNGSSTTVDLVGLQDGTGTDSQTIDTFSFNTGTNILTLEVENDGLAAQTVDLSTLQDGTGTDNQNLTGATLTGTSLQIDIQNGSSTTVDLAGLQDGTGTDNQDLSLSTNTLSLTNDATTVDLSGYLDNTDNQNLTLTTNTLSLTNDATTVDLSGYLDNTDNQAIDLFTFSGTTLGISLQNDGVPPLTVNLSSLQDGTGTDNQDLSLNTNTLSLTNDATTVDLSGYLDNTDNQTIDNFDFNDITNILTLEVENDGVAAQTVDLSTLNDADWFEVGTTTAPNNINDDIFTQGNVAIGRTIALFPLDIETSTASIGIRTVISGNTTGSIFGTKIENSNTGNGSHYGSSNILSGTGPGFQYGSYQNIENTGNGFHYGLYNTLSGTGTGTQYGSFQNIENTGNGFHYGLYNALSGTGTGPQYGSYQDIDNTGGGLHYGSYNNLTGTGTGGKYGSYNSISNLAGGTHYGVYSDVQKATGFAGYFIGRMSLGNMGSNRYIMPASDGTVNQIMQTDGAGQVSFVDVSDISTFAAAKILMSANQSFTGNSWDKINFDTVSFDLTTNFNTTNTRFNVTTAGIYRINASFHSDATSSSTNSFGIAIYVNGSLNKRVQMSHYGNGLIQRDVSTLIDLAVSDKIEIYIYHTGSITINSNGGKTSFEIERIR